MKWKMIPGFEDLYEISTSGQIRSIRNTTSSYIGRELKPYLMPNGYLQIALTKDGRPYKKYIHRLVMLSFSIQCDHGDTVNHKNGIKSDNRIENLEYMSRAMNTSHSHHVLGFSKQGTKNPNCKLSEKDVIDIFNLSKTMKHQEIANMYGISRPSVSEISTGRKWKHLTMPLLCGT